ncbi:MAG TPA: hypothetical protein VFG54_03500, partial [Prolixibacteraceae bacterium]|nr:hypothetical protein [Prolixibacteraceae bacterium]
AAFSVAFLISTFLGWAQAFGVVILVALDIYAFYHTNQTHKKRETALLETPEEVEETRSTKTLYEKCNNAIVKTMNSIDGLVSDTVRLLISENHKELKKQLKFSTQMEEKLMNKRN